MPSRAYSPDYYVSRDAVSHSIAHESLFGTLFIRTARKWRTTRIAALSFELRQRITIEDFAIWITSKEDLIVSKLWWAKDSHSELQLRDVKNLARTGCDMDYIEHWTNELGLLTLWQECKP